MTEKKANQTTRDQALRVARMLGCQGVHEDGKGWMPCASRDEYEAIKKGTEEYLKVRASKKKKPLPKMVQRTKRLETKSDAYYENRSDAVAISRARGCGGVRTVLLAGKKYYAVCNHKAPKRGWENLDEKPISGIATLPGGGLVTGSFSGKSLGRPIGGVAEFDGDGDGFFTGPSGDDNIPAPPKKIVKRVTQHSGTKYLEVFNKQKQEQEKIHGDLSKVENATRALKKNFPNIRKIEFFGDDQETLTPLQLAHTVALLDLSSKNSKVAKTIHRVGGIGFEEYPDLNLPKGTNAACFTTWIGLRKPEKEELIFEHSIGVNEKVDGFPKTGTPTGWGDSIAFNMRREGASEEDINTFWGMYIMNHEWSHAEHNVASWEKLGADMNAKPRETVKLALKMSGMSEKSVDELFASEEEKLKKLNPDISDKSLEYFATKAIYEDKWQIIKSFFQSGKTDDLTEIEIRNLSGNYPRTVSAYATASFNELVAEKASAARMGHPAGVANNPAWRKFHAWLNSGQDAPNSQDGMTRQQRRQAERSSQKKKSYEDDPFFDLNGTEPLVSNSGFIAILDSCEGFTHHSKNSEKSLGRPIGGVAEFDGDSDGFSTGPDGEDNIPFSASVVKTVVSKKVSEILRPTEKFADARKTGRPWKPLTREGWTAELREKFDKRIQSEKDLAKVVAPWYKKSQPYENGVGDLRGGRDQAYYALHSIRGMLEGNGHWGEFKDLEIQFKQLPKELYESKEAQDVLSFAKKFGAPSQMRMQAWNEWAGLYVDHVIASLEKEDVPKTNPFYKQMLSAQNQNFNNNPYYKFMIGRTTGFEAGGKITKAVRDVLRGADAVDAQAKSEEVVSNPNRRIGLNLKENALADLLDGGSLKNIFQNNGKNSFIDEYLVQIKDPQIKDRIRWQMQNRQIADQMLFGIFGSGNKKENHPLSAFFHPNGVEDIGEWGDAYGKISLVMKKDVEARATMTAGDSLAGSFFGASPLNEPKAAGVEGGWAGMVNDQLPSFENAYINKYFEAQIFGGIEISDVAYVAVPQGFKFENPELEQKLKSRGIRVIEVPSSGFVNEPDDLKIKADGKEKTVLLAYSDDSKLYSTGEDTGYIVSDSGKRIKVQSISAVLKFGNWIFNTSDSEKPVQEKGFVNFVSRSTDPDTFSDPESARIRARNLGCIGIRRYTARDGKLVWLPCTNVSDYNRVTGIRGDNSPRGNPRRQGSKFGKKDIQSLIDQTGLISFKGVPKPKKKPPTVTSSDINDLAVRVRNNNAKAKSTAKTNLRDLKIVFLRGLEDGSKEVAKKRVYKFLALLNSDKPADVKYFDDNDLLPLDHPWRNRKTNKKWAGFREGEYGVKYSKGCCPRVVKRHYSNSLTF